MNNSQSTLVEYYNKWYKLNHDNTSLISPSWRTMKSKIIEWYYGNHIPIHRFVAYVMYWDGIFDNWICVRHLNWNSLDNSFENISIWTQSENMRDRGGEALLRSAIHASSFIKKYNHKEVYNAHINWMSYSKIMKEFNIPSKWTISYIIKSIKNKVN